MKVLKTSLPGVVIIEPIVHRDDRGFLIETFHQERYASSGIPGPFAQDNHSHSIQGTLRGLHAQLDPTPQGKLVRAVEGEMFDVAVDIRVGSPHFGKWFGLTLSGENFRQLYVPPGFAHGFMAVSEVAEVLYKTTSYYAPDAERSIRWDDATIGIDWPDVGIEPILNARDAGAPTLGQAEVFS